MTILGNPGEYQNADNSDMWSRVQATYFPEETQEVLNSDAPREYDLWVHGLPTQVDLPVTPLPSPSFPEETQEVLNSDAPREYDAWVHGLPKRVNLQATSDSSSAFYSVRDDLLIDEQPIWLIPALKDLERAAKPVLPVQSAEGYIALVRKLVTSSGIYAVASLASPLVSLVLMPFLTHKLSHTEYGALAVLNTVIALMVGLTQFSLGNALFRAYALDYESKRDRLHVVSTTAALLSLISIPFAIIAIITAPWLSKLLLNSTSFSDPVRLAALIILMQNLTVPGLSWLRVENRAAIYTALGIANLLVNLSTAIVLVGIFHMGINGALLAIGGGYAIIVICTLPVVVLHAGLRLRIDISRNLLSFGLPLVSNFVSVWVLQLSDRYLLSHFGSLAQTASYAVAYSLGGVLGYVILSPFSIAWPSAMFAIAKREDAPQVFQLVFRWYSIVLLFTSFALSFASTVVLNWFFPPAYHSAAPVIPIVTLSITLYAVYNIFTTGISITRKTWFAVVFTSVAALINFGFNLILIPLYGSMGAAASTLLAYAILTLIAYIVNQRIYFIPFQIGTFLLMLAIGMGLYMVSTFLAHGQGTLLAEGIFLGTLILYSGCMVLLGILPFRRHQAKI